MSDAPPDRPTVRAIRLVANYTAPAFDPEKDPCLVWDPEVRVFVPQMPGTALRLPVVKTIAEGQREIAAAVFLGLLEED